MHHHFFFNTLACRNNCKIDCSASAYPAYFRLLRPMRTKSKPSFRSTDGVGTLPSSGGGSGCAQRHNRFFLPVTKPMRVGCFGDRGRTYKTTRRLTYDLPRRYTSWYSRFLHSRCSFVSSYIHNCPSNARKNRKNSTCRNFFCLSRNN